VILYLEPFIAVVDFQELHWEELERQAIACRIFSRTIKDA
jgi:hypothetical protein